MTLTITNAYDEQTTLKRVRYIRYSYEEEYMTVYCEDSDSRMRMYTVINDSIKKIALSQSEE